MGFVKTKARLTMWLTKSLLLLSVAYFGTLVQADVVYVAIQNSSVRVIDTANGNNVKDAGIGNPSYGIVISPDGKSAYVTDYNHSVSVIDTSNNTVSNSITVGSKPWGIAINPTGTRVYVANQWSQSISVINTITHNVESTVKVGVSPIGIAVNPWGTRVYVANYGSNNLSVIDTSNNTVTDTIMVGKKPWGVAVAVNPSVPVAPATDPATDPVTHVYVTNEADDTVSVIDAANNSIVSTLGVGKGPGSIAVNSLGTRAYVANKFDNTVSMINTITNKVFPVLVQVETYPSSIAVNPWGTRLYVTNQTSNSVSMIDIDTANDAIKPIATVVSGGAPMAVAIKPNITKIDGIATNAFVGPKSVMVAGVFISGGIKRSMVRASSVDGIVDPLLKIYTYPDRKLLGTNDSWATDPTAAELMQKEKLIPKRATDAAMIINLPPGLFTAEVSSKNGGSGANVIEVYDLGSL